MIERVLLLPAQYVSCSRRYKTVEIEIDYRGETRKVHSRVDFGMINCHEINEVIISSTAIINTRKYGKLDRARYFETKRGHETLMGYVKLSKNMFDLDWSGAPVRFISPEPSLFGAASGQISWYHNSRAAALTETPYQGLMIEQGFLCRTLHEAQLTNICA